MGRLLFMGEYLNGKRHGKGKEYDYYTGELKFEGEYIYGCRIKGKEYFNYFDHNQKSEYFNPLIYEEQFFNKESLNVKDNNNKIIFEGECLNNIRLNGKGKEYNNNALLFDGEYLNGRKWNGKGYDINGNLIYEIKNGQGNIREYSNSKFIYIDENLKVGDKVKRKVYSKGILIFEGEYLNGKIIGKGKEYNYEGKLIFEGEYLNGKKNGKGKEYNWNVISIYGDEYLNEAKNHYNEKADLVFEGEYLNGKRWNGKGNMMSMDYL